MGELSDAAARVGQILKERAETIAVSESSSGGLVSAALLAIPGASAYFMGGAVIYTAPSRSRFLGIYLDQHPGIRSASEPYALLCAKSAREELGTTWGLAETGAAGPTGNRYGDDAGHSCFGVSGPAELTATVETGITDRSQNMERFAIDTLLLFERALANAG